MYEISITADEARQKVQDIIDEEKLMSGDMFQEYIDEILADVERCILRGVESKNMSALYMHMLISQVSYEAAFDEVKKAFEPHGFNISHATIGNTIYITW